MNLISVDCQKLQDTTVFIAFLWSVPLQGKKTYRLACIPKPYPDHCSHLKSCAGYLLPVRGDRSVGVLRAGRPTLPPPHERSRLEQDGEGAGQTCTFTKSIIMTLSIRTLVSHYPIAIARVPKSCLQVSQMREKDERVRVITEILGGIKVLKLYAWEGSFTDKIDALRDKEIRYLKIMQVS